MNEVEVKAKEIEIKVKLIEKLKNVFDYKIIFGDLAIVDDPMKLRFIFTDDSEEFLTLSLKEIKCLPQSMRKFFAVAPKNADDIVSSLREWQKRKEFIMEQTRQSIDGLPHYDFRKGILSWEDFLKGFNEKIEMKTVLRPLTVSDLADLFAQVERRDVRVEVILMNAKVYTDVRKWGRDTLRMETKKEELQKGLMACTWGAYIMVNNKVPDGVAIAISEEDKKICSILHLDQESFFGLEGLNDLKNKAASLTHSLVQVYSEMEEKINRALSTLKSK